MWCQSDLCGSEPCALSVHSIRTSMNEFWSDVPNTKQAYNMYNYIILNRQPLHLQQDLLWLQCPTTISLYHFSVHSCLSFTVCMCTSIDVLPNDATTEGSVRLVGGDTLLEGRVEVFLLGQWGTVCDRYWDLADATVVCHQLGYLRAVEAPRLAFFGAGSGPSWYRYVYCTGTERNLTECYNNNYNYNFGHACSHSRDAGVVCSGQFYSLPCFCCVHTMKYIVACVCILLKWWFA